MLHCSSLTSTIAKDTTVAGQEEADFCYPEMPVTFFAAAAVTPHKATIRCLLFISVNMNCQSKKSQISIKDVESMTNIKSTLYYPFSNLSE